MLAVVFMRALRLLPLAIAFVVIAALPCSVATTRTAHAAFAGDSGKIVFVRRPNASSQEIDIWMMDADGSHQTKLTNSPGEDSYPAWSPDGAQIAFTSVRDGHNAREIYVMNADGSNQRNLTNNPAADDAFPAWSPNGRQIAFNGSGGLTIMKADGSHPTVVPSNVYWPTWSPDGKMIAGEGAGGSGVGLARVNADGSGHQQLTSGEQAWFPDWSPDGSSIVYTSPNTQVGAEVDIRVFNVTSGTSTTVHKNSYSAGWSPDGQKIVFNRMPAAHIGLFEGISTINKDGSGVINLTNSFDSLPDWQPVCDSAHPGDLGADTDGDNIPNSVEINVAKTDPCKKDTDGDGLLDPWEVDPSVPGAGFDLDGDGKPDVSRDDVFGSYAGQCPSDFFPHPRREPSQPFCDLVKPPDPLHKDVYAENSGQASGSQGLRS